MIPSDKPRWQIVPLDGSAELADLLRLVPPPFTRTDPFRQLSYITGYLRERKCRSVLIEEHYVDRDFIEDYSLFYSLSLFPYQNYCKRLHFFSLDPGELGGKLHDLLVACRADPDTARDVLKAFAETSYLGFTVVKPLAGSPVGRTVLSCYPEKPDDLPDQRRLFTGTRTYQVHLGPIELPVRGLAFQQQDLGVSACATTAIWSALHKVRDFEEIGAPSPAQITTLATRYSLPFGRPMPSDEGLSVDQMCQALQALKVAPQILHANRFDVGRSYLYSALRSSFAPVLVVRGEYDPNIRHAITVAGMRLAHASADGHVPVEGAAELLALYVHDDRMGPYLRTNLIKRFDTVVLETVREKHPVERWRLEFLLLPLHPKIRLSLSALREICINFVTDILEVQSVQAPIRFEYWFARTHTYLQELLRNPATDVTVLERITNQVDLPRYLGIARMGGPHVGQIDLLVDSTSTLNNLNCLAIVRSGTEVPIDLAALAARYEAVQI